MKKSSRVQLFLKDSSLFFHGIKREIELCCFFKIGKIVREDVILKLWYSLFVIDVILRVLLILFEFESTSLFHEYFINFCTKMVLILWFNDVNMPWKIQFKHLLYSSPCCPMFACTLGIEIIKVLKFRGKWNRLTS